LLRAFQVDNQHRPKLLQYLDKNYFKETELQRWMVCFRENLNSAGINTNNYVESWHNALKMYFLKDRQKRRVDVVIHILAKSVVPFYEYKLTSARHSVGRMTSVQRAAANGRIKASAYIAMRRSQGYAGQFVFPTDDPAIIHAPSFEQDPAANLRMYELRLDFSRVRDIGEIISCQCPHFRRIKACCKHIALVILEKEPIAFRVVAAQWEHQGEAPVDMEPIDAQDDPLDFPPIPEPKEAEDPSVEYIQRLRRLDLDEEHLARLKALVEHLEMECPRKDVDDWRRRRDRQQRY
jgi:SWIM zinc finger